MKPISIKIKGINSYVSEQRIDFGKLAESNVFGIFGETGSGKTTILDSIILALYGVSDRDSLQNIINVHTKDAYVEFVFEMENNDGKINTYFVRRDFHLRPSGLKTEAIINDTKKKKTLAEMPENVNNKILEIIGVGKKEFTKCIALPQGEFDRFLSDTPALRKKTLAKLFDLEQFGIILNDKLKKRKNEVVLNKSTIEEKISVYNGISEEAIKKTEEILANSDKELKTLSRQIERDKKLVERIKSELVVKQELLDMEVNLSLKQTELTEINFLEKQVEYTEKYGDFTILNNKYNNCINEVATLQESIDENKKLLLSFNEDLNKYEILSQHNKEKASAIEKQLQELKLDEEKRKLHESRLATLQDEKKVLNKKIIDTSQKLDETNTLIKANKASIVTLENNYKKLETTIFDNMDTIDKLNNCQSLKTKQDFALFLTITKNKINPESLAEVENFDIHDEVTHVIHDIENFELGVRKEVGDILRDLKTMDISDESIEEVKDEFIKKNEILNAKCDEIEEKLITTKENLATAKSIVANCQASIDEYAKDMEKLKNQMEAELQELRGIRPSNDLDYLTRTLDKYQKEEIIFQDSINKLISKKQKTMIAIEVATNNLDSYSEKINTLGQALKPYSKTTFKNKVDNALLVDYDELPSIKEKIANFRQELKALEINCEKLREKTKDYIYSKDDYNSLVESVLKNEDKLSDLKVFINVNKITIDIQKQNLETVKELNTELDIAKANLDTIEKLESLLSGGALIEFVAEEYMGLITEFANSYVYQISKGKYLLNYDGDFNVIDNFNGGIKRTVKTLSGGERFIVSLSLALGISQSIAINNNKNFNFFFIDEGFGNLSENYIDKVLQSFDALIKLNFTVGFITHVEKMQYYLNNRIIVTKENNDEGSKVEQFF